jgi:tRNA threonylcarbamoyladenosine biosynthesis protein TsaE
MTAPEPEPPPAPPPAPASPDAPRDARPGAPSALALALPDPAATERVGAALGRALAPGDAVLLEGPLGAGKSALARAAISARLADAGRVEEVPSPTFTLVQVYDADGVAIWHADLYRLSGPAEVRELGLGEAFRDAISLVEWPDRLGPLAPPRALAVRLGFAPHGDGRLLTLAPRGPGWARALEAAAAAA